MCYEKTVGNQTVLPSFKPQKNHRWSTGVKVSLVGQVRSVGVVSSFQVNPEELMMRLQEKDNELKEFQRIIEVGMLVCFAGCGWVRVGGWLLESSLFRFCVVFGSFCFFVGPREFLGGQDFGFGWPTEEVKVVYTPEN